MLKLSKTQIIGLIISLILLSTLLIWSFSNKKKLLEDHRMTIGLITDCSYGGRGNAGTITFIFNFLVDNSKIGGTSSISSKELNYSDAKLYLLGKTFPVIYNPKNPQINYILIRPNDFKKFSYLFPDSLNWVLKYAH